VTRLRQCDRDRCVVALTIITFGIGFGIVHGGAPTEVHVYERFSTAEMSRTLFAKGFAAPVASTPGHVVQAEFMPASAKAVQFHWFGGTDRPARKRQNGGVTWSFAWLVNRVWSSSPHSAAHTRRPVHACHACGRSQRCSWQWLRRRAYFPSNDVYSWRTWPALRHYGL